MARVWSEQNKADKWLQVQIAIVESSADIGAIAQRLLQERGSR